MQTMLKHSRAYLRKTLKMTGVSSVNCREMCGCIPQEKLTTGGIKTWGVKLEKGLPIQLKYCEDSVHGQHDYLAPFHQANPELLMKYQEIMDGHVSVQF